MNQHLLSLFFALALTLTPIPHVQAGDYRGAWVLGPLDATDIRMYNEEKELETVFVMRAADDHIFDDPKLFPSMKNVSLSVNASNLGNLRMLAKNYPALSCITVRQTEELSDEAVKYLLSFKQLKSLELSCPVRSPSLLLRGLPIGLEQLEIRNSNLAQDEAELECLQQPPKIHQADNKVTASLLVTAGDGNGGSLNLSNLRELTVERGGLAPSFLRLLNAPRLRRLCLFGVTVPTGALNNLNRFGALRDLNLAGSTLTKEELAELKSVHADIVAPNHTKYRVE